MNLHDLLKNFSLQDLQNQMQNMQESLKHITVSGSSGGGMVTIEMNGSMEITNLFIDPELVNEQDREMLQDLLIAAFEALLINWRERVQQETAGMSFPGLFGNQS